MKSVAVLIDNMYLENLGKAYGVPKIDIEKFGNHLLEKDEERHRTYVFDALPYVAQEKDDLTEEQRLRIDEQKIRRNEKYRYLDRLKYLDRVAVEYGEVRAKSTTCYRCNRSFNVPIQKLVDVKLSVRLVSLAWSDKVDKIILVTGDYDILPAVESAEDSQTTIRLVYGEVPESNIGTSHQLIKKCHEKRKLTKGDLEICRLAVSPVSDSPEGQ